MESLFSKWMSKYREEQDKPKGVFLGRSLSGRKESWYSLEVWASCQRKQTVCHADVHMLEVHLEWNTSFPLKYRMQANSGKYSGKKFREVGLLWSQTGAFFTTLEIFMILRTLVIEIVTIVFLEEHKSVWVASGCQFGRALSPSEKM